MVGHQIYLIFCKHLSDGCRVHETFQTPHATFDGAYEHMQRIAEHFSKEKGFKVTHVGDGSFYVDGPFGLKRMYYVSTRTIEK
jgi:hypothetical protein